ncbi:hypothetical protein [Brevibacillus porteri]|uniref:Peptidase n=1 Tax=Brevibacillus porteri TaxID=2126350 RepID=A0ABX5FJU5_9BACL|nr:hypothetical protein [Brevibacillus porteri]MED1801396.1 hypothetical protein [Brevibacillus porteri]MED2132784.1 hypothetical protein [Brevibacillus porteri]MED2747767.1 hypothetical protein [Brevibacillus porteri]MED2817547.1 hypothetical protein [Brevibacillus porteri]MED2895489.1 hypothetical protein [Brevibacillus porteri]
MKKQALVTASMAALLLSAVSPLGSAQAQTNMVIAANKVQAITFDQLVKEMDKKQPISMFIESTHTSKGKQGTETQKAKTWDNTIKGEWREEISDGKRVQHAAGKAGQVAAYQEGGSGFVHSATIGTYDNEINKTKRELQRLKVALPDSKVAITVKEAQLLNRAVYHVVKKEDAKIDGKLHHYQDDLWIDKETGLLLKRTFSHNQAQAFSYTVDKVDFQPVFDEKTFEVSIPAGVEQRKFSPEVEKVVAEVTKLFPDTAKFSDYDNYGIEGNWQLLKMFEAQKRVYSPTPRAEAFVIMDTRTNELSKVMIQNPEWVSKKLPAEKVAKEKAAAFLKQLVGDQASQYKVEAKVEQGGGRAIFEDYVYGFVTAEVTFRPAKGKGITISVDEAGRIVGFKYTDE